MSSFEVAALIAVVFVVVYSLRHRRPWRSARQLSSPGSDEAGTIRRRLRWTR